VATRIFISYRRDDTAAAAGRVYDRLWRLIGKTNVFFDVSAIGGGEDFANRIVTEIAASEAVLVFIGRKWLEPAGDGGKPRLFAADDYVRAELRAALGRSVLVLPVLVDGARMPGPDQLPDDVKGIATRNALPIRHETFDDDTENVVSTVLGVSARQRLWDDKGKLWVKLAYTAGGLVLGLIAVVLLALAHTLALGRPLEASIGGAATNLLLVAGALLGGWAGFMFEARRRRRKLLRAHL
jgi:hypothetical protein